MGGVKVCFSTDAHPSSFLLGIRANIAWADFEEFTRIIQKGMDNIKNIDWIFDNHGF